MARHLRVFAAVRADGPSPFAESRPGSSGWSSTRSCRPRCSRTSGPALIHDGIFWGFVLLTIGTANIVTGGIIQAVLSCPFDGMLWALISALQNVVAVIVLRVDRLGVLPAARDPARRLTFNRDALMILGMIGGVVATELLAEAFEFAAHGDQPGAFVSNAAGRPAAGFPRARRPGSRVRRAVVGATSRWSRRSCATCRSRSTCTSPRASRTSVPQARAARRAAGMDLEDENATFGLKTLQDLGWKDLLDGFTCTECGRCQEACPRLEHGQAAQPEDVHHGHPGHVGRGRARARPDPELADRPRDLRPGRPATALRRRWPEPIVDTAIPYDAVWDCVTCGACVEACPVLIEHVDKIVGLRRNLVLEEIRFPAELTPAFRTMEARATRGASRRRPGRTGRSACRSRSRRWRIVAAAGRARRARGPVLGRLRCGVRSTQPEGGPGGRDVPPAAGVSFAILGQEESCTGDPARRMGNDYVFQILAGARRDPEPLRDGGAHDHRDRLPTGQGHAIGPLVVGHVGQVLFEYQGLVVAARRRRRSRGSGWRRDVRQRRR